MMGVKGKRDTKSVGEAVKRESPSESKEAYVGEAAMSQGCLVWGD